MFLSINGKTRHPGESHPWLSPPPPHFSTKPPREGEEGIGEFRPEVAVAAVGCNEGWEGSRERERNKITNWPHAMQN